MKLTTIILLSACMAASASGGAQGISLNEKKAPLVKLLQEIKRQSGYDFFYNLKTLESAGSVSVNIKNASLLQALDACFKNTELTYTISEKVIVISKKDKLPNGNDKAVSLSGVEDKAPPIDVKGRVTNEAGEPIAGASVKIKGTDIGTSTNDNGEFTLNVLAPDMVLVISGVNIETIEVPIAARTSISITAKMKETSLSEIIINKGYYTEKQKYSVGNIGRVSSSEIEKQPVQNPLLSLQGRVPGLLITQNSGISGGGVTIRIGSLQNSISNGNDPLIVIDGVPYPSNISNTGLENALIGGGLNNPSPLDFINSADIASIDVLKDADATAIYGSRAANGALLITTKRAKPGKLRATINLQQGWGKIASKMDMLNTKQYLEMRYEAFKNDGIDWTSSSVSADDLKFWDTTRYTDWQKELIGGTAKYFNVNSSISGGTELAQYLIGMNFNRTTTVFPGDFDDKRVGVHFSINSSSLNKKLKVELSGNYYTNDNNLPGSDLTNQAVNLAPDAPKLFLSDGSLNWELDSAGNSTWTNPLANVRFRRYSNSTDNLISNLVLSYTLFKGLELRSSVGYNKLFTEDYLFTPLEAEPPQNRIFAKRTSQFGKRNIHSWIIEPQANYSSHLGNGEINLSLGSSIQQSSSESGNIIATGFSSDDVMRNLSAATNLSSSVPSVSKYKYTGVFGRINYIFKDKYSINITGRRDGSSRFGEKNRFHTFASTGVGWIFSEESFIKQSVNFLSFGKLRFSYGTSGNDQVGDYNFLSLYYNTFSYIPYQNMPGLVTYQLTNPYLQWEETKKLQAGIDVGLLKDKINISLTYTNNRSSNQLLGYNLPSITGFTSVNSNFPALVLNTSWELSINADIIKQRFIKWNSSLNLTRPYNKLISFPDLKNSSYRYNLVEGQPIQLRKLYSFKGVDATTGDYLFIDSHGNSTSTPDFFSDANILVNTFPTVYGGFQNTVSYKDIELSFLFQFVKQNQSQTFFNSGSYNFPGAVSLLNNLGNMPVSVLNRWQKSGDVAEIRKYSTVLFQPSDILNSTANVKDASFIRLKNVHLSWHPNLKKSSSTKLKVFVEGQNLLTITKYNGMDPETLFTSLLPPLKMWIAGFQIEL